MMGFQDLKADAWLLQQGLGLNFHFLLSLLLQRPLLQRLNQAESAARQERWGIVEPVSVFFLGMLGVGRRPRRIATGVEGRMGFDEKLVVLGVVEVWEAQVADLR